MDKDLKEVRDEELIQERKNYTYRLSIYYAKLFANVCEDEKIPTVSMLEKWIKDFVKPYEEKYKSKILKELSQTIQIKREQETSYRKKQKSRKRKK